MVDTVDLNQVAVLLTRIAQNYNEILRNWEKIFFDNIPDDAVPLKFYDEDGNLVEFVIPNRAADRRYIFNGHGEPTEDEQAVSAPLGSIYQDLENGEFWIKRLNTDENAVSPDKWQKFTSFEDNYIRGDHVPDDYADPAEIGTLYTDMTTGYLYTMTNKGWAQAGASGYATMSWVQSELDKLNLEIEGGVVHVTKNETIRGVKTFAKTERVNGVMVESSVNFDGDMDVDGYAYYHAPVEFDDICTFKKVIMGTSYRALSADIAEFYDADDYIAPGTLVCFGGEKEITKATDVVNAVVSTNPAYILNDNVNMEFPTLLAMSGRIPVRVKGPVHKFDKIILSNEAGIAVAVDKDTESCYNIIGRALEDNLQEEEKLVECVVKLEL